MRFSASSHRIALLALSACGASVHEATNTAAETADTGHFTLPAPDGVGDAISAYTDLTKVFGAYNRCIAQGGTQEQCLKVTLMCAVRDKIKPSLPRPTITVGGTPIGVDTTSLIFGDVFGAFRNYSCDDGCFHCCAPPRGGDGGGCHTAFDSTYQPQINCGIGIYQGYVDQGPALLVDAQPGDWCLVIQHDCNIYPACEVIPESPIGIATGGDPGSGSDGSSGSDDDGDSGSDTPPPAGDTPPLPYSSASSNGCVTVDWSAVGMTDSTPLLSADDSVDKRALRFLKGVDGALIASFNAGTPGFTNGQVMDFLTNRGAAGWSTFMQHQDGFSGRFPNVPVTNADGTFNYAASVAEELRIAGISSLVHSIPNLYGRLAFVESHVWNDDGKKAYLQFTPDPDAALLQTMSPFALALLKSVPTLQDYRLLAVPTCDESSATTPLVDGFTKGVTPQASLTRVESCDSGNGLVTVTLDIACPGGVDCTTAGTMPVALDWGDGHVTHQTAAPGSATYSHTYAGSGAYTVMATVVGESGLRGAASVVVDVHAAGTATPLPALADVAIGDLKVYATDWDAGIGRFRIGLETADGDQVELGSTQQEIAAQTPGATFESSDPTQYQLGYTVSLGTLTGVNDRGVVARKIMLWPARLLSNTPYNPINFRFESLTIGIRDATGTIVHRTLPFTDDLVHIFLSSANQPAVPGQLSAGRDGHGDATADTWIPLHRWDGIGQGPETVDRIEIDITPALLAGLPIQSPTPGTAMTYLEGSAGLFAQQPASPELVTACDPVPAVQPYSANASIAVYKDGVWAVRDLNRNSAGTDRFLDFQETTSDTLRPQPVVGDWGGHGHKRVGTVRKASWFLNRSDQTQSFEFGRAISVGWNDGTDLPIVGKWLGDGRDYVGVYNVANTQFILNGLDSGYYTGHGFVFQLGQAGDVPVVGDWIAAHRDSVGLYRASTGEFILDERTHNRDATLATGVVTQFAFGMPNDVPVVGRWLGDGVTYVGTYRPSTGEWSLAKTNTAGADAITFQFGMPDDVPVVLDLYGDGHDHVGLYRPATGEWFIAKQMGRFDDATTLHVADFGGPGYTPLTGLSWSATGYSASWPGPESTAKELPDNAVADGWLDMTGNVLLMHMDEPGTSAGTLGTGFDIQDSSGHANHGTVTSNVNFSFPGFGSVGQVDEGFKVGGDKYLAIAPTPSLELTSAMTISAWVRADVDDFDRGIAVKTDQDWSTGYGLYLSYSWGICGFVSSRWNHACAPFTVTNTFRHVATTYDGATLKVFVDGVLVNTLATNAGISPSLERFTVGGQPSSFYYNWAGNLDEVAVWNRALADTEIQAIYERQK